MLIPTESVTRWMIVTCTAAIGSCALISCLPPAFAAEPGSSPFRINRAPAVLLISCPATHLQVEFSPDSGRFSLQVPGFPSLHQVSLRFRSDGESYSFPETLLVKNSAIRDGKDTTGAYAEVAVLWEARDQTRVRTAVRLYNRLPAVLFEQSYPRGAHHIEGRDASSVGCAFPVFEAPPAPPADLGWLSYTYQDWPIPLRGSGWPASMPDSHWPAAGHDDRVRTPLVFFNQRRHAAVLSPLDNGLQQLVVLAPSRPASEPVPALEPGPAPDHGVPGSGSAAIPSPADTADRTILPPSPVSPARPRTAVLVGAAGRLIDLPRGATFHSVLYLGESGVQPTLLAWGHFLQQFNGKHSRPAPEDMTLHSLGYWTDNGAAYYYQSEGNAGYPATLQALRMYFAEKAIPIQYYQLDSWWYIRGPDSGSLLWTANPLLLPRGVPGATGASQVPLVLHNRYWSRYTPYRLAGEFSPGWNSAVPVKSSLFDRLLQPAAEWGCRLYEQDWLSPQFRKVDYLQTTYGAPGRWLTAMDQGAAHQGMNIQFCMPSMGFYLASAGLPHVSQIRTSDDFSRDNWNAVRLRWVEHLHLSLLATALGMAPSKDVFLTSREYSTRAGAWEQVEALLAILSGGPVGIGDPFGHTDIDLIQHLCLEDGRLVQPDMPAVPVEDSLTGVSDQRELPLAAETQSTISGQTWRYLLTLSLGDTRTLGARRRRAFSPAGPPPHPRPC